VSLAAWVAESSLGHVNSVHSCFWVFLYLRRKYACVHKRLYSYMYSIRLVPASVCIYTMPLHVIVQWKAHSQRLGLSVLPESILLV
jgi:hypothetical protein